MDYLALYVTLKLAVVTTVVLMVMAAPIAYLLAYSRFPGKSFVEALIYLPMALTLLIPLGALAGHFYNRWAERQSDPAFAERMGVLAATGLIVGESLFGVAFAGIAAVTGSPEALAVLERNPVAEIAGLLIFSGTVTGLYRWTRRAVSRS